MWRLEQVTEGSGRMLVVAVGAESEWGRTMALVATEAQPTPLQVPCLPCPLPSACCLPPVFNTGFLQPLLEHATGIGQCLPDSSVWLSRMH